MRYGIAILAAAVLILSVSTQGAYAVGYERCDRSGSPVRAQQAYDKCRNMSSTMTKTFAKKGPQLIEGVADSVKGILSQFGLVDLKRP